MGQVFDNSFVIRLKPIKEKTFVLQNIAKRYKPIPSYTTLHHKKTRSSRRFACICQKKTVILQAKLLNTKNNYKNNIQS